MELLLSGSVGRYGNEMEREALCLSELPLCTIQWLNHKLIKVEK